MKIITCFSYKGGAGRTVASANIAAALASKMGNAGTIRTPLNRKVAIIDLDVFSAGTHRVFGLSNRDLKPKGKDKAPVCVQDYLQQDIQPCEYVKKGGISLEDNNPFNPLMETFKRQFNAADNCRPDLTLFPAHPDPEKGWVVQKLHENALLDFVQELEQKQGFDYLIIDGESGTRSMADIALRLADVLLVFFRLTWQHIEGSLDEAERWDKFKPRPTFYLIPTCVPLVDKDDKVYQDTALGLLELRDLTERIPRVSRLNDYANSNRDTSGCFWSGALCVHESLVLKGEERILVFDSQFDKDRAPQDYYSIAAELDKRHGPGASPNKRQKPA